DSGSSNSDDLTNLTTLTFDIAAAPFFRVGRNGVQISGDYESGSTYTASSQAAGTWSYAVQAVDAAGNASGFGPALNLTIDLTVPTVLGLVAVAPDPRTTPVSTVDMAFSEPIDLSTLTVADLSLTRDGSPVALTGAVTMSLVSGATYRISGLDGFTAAPGAYALTVNAAGVLDLAGNSGTGSASDTWTISSSSSTTASASFVALDATTLGNWK